MPGRKMRIQIAQPEHERDMTRIERDLLKRERTGEIEKTAVLFLAVEKFAGQKGLSGFRSPLEGRSPPNPPFIFDKRNANGLFSIDGALRADY